MMMVISDLSFMGKLLLLTEAISFVFENFDIVSQGFVPEIAINASNG